MQVPGNGRSSGIGVFYEFKQTFEFNGSGTTGSMSTKDNSMRIIANCNGKNVTLYLARNMESNRGIIIDDFTISFASVKCERRSFSKTEVAELNKRISESLFAYITTIEISMTKKVVSVHIKYAYDYTPVQHECIEIGGTEQERESQEYPTATKLPESRGFVKNSSRHLYSEMEWRPEPGRHVSHENGPFVDCTMTTLERYNSDVIQEARIIPKRDRAALGHRYYVLNRTERPMFVVPFTLQLSAGDIVSSLIYCDCDMTLADICKKFENIKSLRDKRKYEYTLVGPAGTFRLHPKAQSTLKDVCRHVLMKHEWENMCKMLESGGTEFVVPYLQFSVR